METHTFASFRKAIRLRNRQKPLKIAIHVGKQDLHHLIKNDIEMCADRQAIVSSMSEDLQNIDPLSLHLLASYDSDSAKHTYKLLLYRYGILLFQDVQVCKMAWEFCGDVPKVVYGVEGLEKCHRQFKMVYKNGKIEFTDALGHGIFKILPDVQDHFYVESVDHAHRLEMVSIFNDVVHNRPRKDGEAKAKVIVWIMNKLLILENAQRKMTDRTLEESRKLVDITYVRRKTEDIKLVFESIIEGLLPDFNSLKQAAQKDSHDVEEFMIFVMVLRNIAALAENKNMEDSEFVKSLIDLTQLKMMLEIVPSCVSGIFNDAVKVKRVRDSFNQDLKEECTFYANYLKKKSLYQESGLVWRYSIQFWRFVRKGLIGNLISRAYGIRVIVPLAGKEIPMQESCLKVLELPHTEVFVCDTGIAWREKSTSMNGLGGSETVNKYQYSMCTIESSRDIIYRDLSHLIVFARLTRGGVHKKIMGWLDIETILEGPEGSPKSPIHFSQVEVHKMASYSLRKDSLMLVHQTETQGGCKMIEIDVKDLNRAMVVKEYNLKDMITRLFEKRGFHPPQLANLTVPSNNVQIFQTPDSIIMQLLLYELDGSISQHIFDFTIVQTTHDEYYIDLRSHFTMSHRNTLFLMFQKASSSTLIFSPEKIPALRSAVILFSGSIEFHMTVQRADFSFQTVYNWQSSRVVLRKMTPKRSDTADEKDKCDKLSHLSACWSHTLSKVIFVAIWKHKQTFETQLEYLPLKISLS